MHTKEIDINGQRINYYESGGIEQPILFIHGNSMSGISYEKQIKSQLGERYRLIALDLPGHGGSDPAIDPESAYTLPAYATLVSEFAQELGIVDAMLVGWSLGGHVLLEAIEQLQESVGLMIFGAPPVGKPMAANAFIPHPHIPLLFKSELSSEEAVAVTETLFKPGAQIPKSFYEDFRRADGRAREVLGQSIAEGNYTDEVKVVANVNKPLAVIHGENDELVSLSYVKGLDIPTLWRGEVQIIPDASHSPHWEQPESFNSILMEFITDCRSKILYTKSL